MGLVMLQLNTGKGYEATTQLRCVAGEKWADVVLIQEPAPETTSWPGWTLFKGHQGGETEMWVRDGLPSLMVEQFTGELFTTVVMGDITGHKCGNCIKRGKYTAKEVAHQATGRRCLWYIKKVEELKSTTEYGVAHITD